MTREFDKYQRYPSDEGHEKYSLCPIDDTKFFFSKEAKEVFDSSPENIKKTAMALLERTCKQSMRRIEMEFISNALTDIYERVERLEGKI